MKNKNPVVDTEMESLTGTIESHDGLSLFYRAWHPTTKPRGIIVFFHGGGGHSGQPTYHHFTDHFLRKGYALYGLDQRGHGRSEGDKFHIEKIEDIRQDIDDFLKFVKQRNDGESLFALGQSMGGLFVLDYCLHDPIELKGAISVAPGLNLEGIPTIVQGIFRLLSKIAPKWVLKVRGVDLSAASRDPVESKKIKSDPLTSLSSTPNTLLEIVRTVERVHRNAPKFQIPLLMIHGSDDRISPPIGSKRFFEATTLTDKTLNLIQGGYHQPFIDVNREEVFSDLEAWIENHL